MVAALLLVSVSMAGCADLTPGKYVKVLSAAQAQEMDSWRLWLGIIFGVELLVSVIAAIKCGAGMFATSVLSGFLGIWINWTIFGEWGYRLAAWIFSWGVIGKVLAVLGGVLGGGLGAGLLLCVPYGIVFNDLEMLKYVGVSSAISGAILAIGLTVAAVKE